MKCKNFGVKCNVKTALFNFKGEIGGRYCYKCKEPNMVDVVHFMCIDCGEKRPNFNFKNEKKALYCIGCALSDMIDVTHPKCVTCLKIRPNFNYPGEKIPLYCFEHSLEDMIDVTHPKCKCGKRASFNYFGEKVPLYCKKDSLPEMIDITERRKCISEKCDKIPIFNFENEISAINCFYCKLPEMIDIRHKHFNCSSCGLRYRKYNIGQTLCWYCNPDRNHKTKENEIKKLLEKHNYTFIQDKSIALDKTVCKSYRPDFLFDCTFYYVIIEVDEFKHRGTANTCDYNRMEAIQKILGLPVTFIRYNPDSKESSKLERESKLLEKLDFYLDLKIQKLDLLTINYLFY